MKKILKIIKEELSKLFENYDDVDWDLYDAKDIIQDRVLNDFLYNNNSDFTKRVSWTVIPFNRLKKIWEDYIRLGFVRDEKGLEKIEGIVTRNILKVHIFTELSGHTSYDPSEIFESFFDDYIDIYLTCYFKLFQDPNQLEIDFDDPQKGYKKKQNILTASHCKGYENKYLNEIMGDIDLDEISDEKLKSYLIEKLTDRFYDYYMVDNSGREILSDYGLDPLLRLLEKLRKETKPEKKIVIIDKILNVVHMRSDIAAWFIEGGSDALSKLSGYHGDDGESVISGDDGESVIRTTME